MPVAMNDIRRIHDCTYREQNTTTDFTNYADGKYLVGISPICVFRYTYNSILIIRCRIPPPDRNTRDLYSPRLAKCCL